MRVLPWLLLACLPACGGDTPSVTRDASVAVDAAVDASETDAAIRPGPECDPRMTASCAANEKCTTTRWALDQPWPAPRCVADLGADGPHEGETCFSAPGFADGCGTGLSCTNFGSGEGFCKKSCARGEACAEGQVCAPLDPATGFALCLDACTDDASCGAAGWLKCVEQGDLRYCESTRAK
jgi:hypothetical protein